MKLILLLAMMVLPALAQAQSINTLVKELTSSLDSPDEVSLAVLEFSYAGSKASDGPAIIQERITTALVRQGIGTVVERNLLDRVMGELRLQRSGIIDPDTIKELGKVLGVDAVVTGTLNDMKGGKVEVNARLINTETAEVVGASAVEIPKTWEDTAVIQPALVLPKEATDAMTTKAYMDAQLQQLKRSGVTSNKPGTVTMGGTTVSNEEFSRAVMQTMVDGLKDKGLSVPPLVEQSTQATED